MIRSDFRGLPTVVTEKKKLFMTLVNVVRQSLQDSQG